MKQFDKDHKFSEAELQQYRKEYREAASAMNDKGLDAADKETLKQLKLLLRAVLDAVSEYRLVKQKHSNAVDSWGIEKKNG